MKNMDFRITVIKRADKPLVSSFISENWGTSKVVKRGRIHNAEELSGFICISNDKIIGLITYKIEGDECEIVTLDSKLENKGLGTSLVNKVKDAARGENVKESG